MLLYLSPYLKISASIGSPPFIEHVINAAPVRRNFFELLIECNDIQGDQNACILTHFKIDQYRIRLSENDNFDENNRKIELKADKLLILLNICGSSIRDLEYHYNPDSSADYTAIKQAIRQHCHKTLVNFAIVNGDKYFISDTSVIFTSVIELFIGGTISLGRNVIQVDKIYPNLRRITYKLTNPKDARSLSTNRHMHLKYAYFHEGKESMDSKHIASFIQGAPEMNSLKLYKKLRWESLLSFDIEKLVELSLTCFRDTLFEEDAKKLTLTKLKSFTMFDKCLEYEFYNQFEFSALRNLTVFRSSSLPDIEPFILKHKDELQVLSIPWTEMHASYKQSGLFILLDKMEKLEEITVQWTSKIIADDVKQLLFRKQLQKVTFYPGDSQVDYLKPIIESTGLWEYEDYNYKHYTYKRRVSWANRALKLASTVYETVPSMETIRGYVPNGVNSVASGFNNMARYAYDNVPSMETVRGYLPSGGRNMAESTSENDSNKRESTIAADN